MNPICRGFAKAGIGGLIGGLSSLAAAVNDECFEGSYLEVFGIGAMTGIISSTIPGTGPLAGSIARFGMAGFVGNSTGQLLVNDGFSGYSFSESITQGGIGALSGATGNVFGMTSSLHFLYRGYNTQAALAIGASEGGTAALAIEISANLATSTNLGGINPSENSSCSCKAK